MSVRITHVRFEDGVPHTHESITAYQYVDESSGVVSSKWKASMVAFIEDGTVAYVGLGANRVRVGVVDATPKYLRTYADGKYNNNLLSLPSF